MPRARKNCMVKASRRALSRIFFGKLNMSVYDTKLYSIYSNTSIGHIIIGQLHYLWGKKVEQSIIVLGILTLTIPLNPSIIYGSFLKFQSF